MRSKLVNRLLRALMVLLGAGIGAALTALVFHIIALYGREEPQPLMTVVLAYSGACLVGGVIFFFLSARLLEAFSSFGSAVMRRFDEMTDGQLMGCIGGLIAGLLIAALFSRMLTAGGALGIILAAMLYVMLGAIGWTVGWKRGEDVVSRLSGHRLSGKRFKRKKGSQTKRSAVAIADISALVDGRVLGIAQAGFIGTGLVVPDFVAEQAHHLAASSDPQKAARGKRAEAVLTELGSSVKVYQTEHSSEADDADVRLVRLAARRKAPMLTCSGSLAKLAALSGVRVMNINALAEAMRQALSAGDMLTLTVVKKGREAGQGVAYLEDGTMVVIDGAEKLVEQTVQAEVASVLQTSAGRMVFARVAAG